MKKGRELIDEINAYQPEKGKFGLWWLGQASFVLKLGNKCLYIDPFFSDFEARLTKPLFDASLLTNADYILGTHNHVDHIDSKFWPGFSESSPQAKFIVPLFWQDALSEKFAIDASRMIGVGNDVAFEEDGLKISAIPSAHEFLDRDPDTGEYPAVGYVIEYEGNVIYHSGDCCLYEGLETRLKACKKFDLMMLPITGRSAAKFKVNFLGNMTYQEAVDLAGNVKPACAMPMHFDAFEGNTEDPTLFSDYLEAKYPGIPCVIPKHGELMVFPL